LRRRLRKARRGQVLTEHVLIAAGLTLMVTAILVTFGPKLRNLLASASDALGEETEEETVVTVFFDDFTGDASNWNMNKGARKWVLQDGELWATRRGERRAFAKNSSGGNQTITTTATLHSGRGFGLFFRADGEKRVDGYTFQYDPGYRGGKFTMRKWTNGRAARPFAVADPPDGFQWTETQRDVQLVTQGSNFQASIDGEVVLTASDDSYATGMAGLRVWSNSQASFDDFQVVQR